MYVIEEATSGLLWKAVMLHHCGKKKNPLEQSQCAANWLT